MPKPAVAGAVDSGAYDAETEPDTEFDATETVNVEPLQLPGGLPPNLVPADFQETLDDLPSALGPHAGVGQDLVNDFVASALEIGRHRATDEDGARRQLQARWGDDTDAKLANVDKAMKALGGYSGSFAKWLDQTGLGNDPAVLVSLEAFGSDQLGNKITPTSKAKAVAEHSAIMKNPKHAYWRGDKDAVAKVPRLAEVVFGGEPINAR